MIRGLSHITLLCRDLERMAAILIGVLDAREVYSSGPESFSVAPEKFFLVGDVWLAVMEGERAGGRSYEHIAFRVAAADLPGYRERIARMGLQERPSRPRVQGEGDSIYFHDDDGHLFELHSGTLEARLARYGRGRAA